MKGNVTITKNEYYNLRLEAERMRRLDCGGVDNWEWYGEALNPSDEQDIFGYEEELKEEIFNM